MPGAGQQVFVIAKITNRYRALAVVHHQWLYGSFVLKRGLGIRSIFSASANRLPIQQELTAARRLDDDFWTKDRSCVDLEVPFPFITTSLLLGASFDVKDCYDAPVTVQPFNVACSGDHHDGVITVIDITDLAHIRYCFVLLDNFNVFHGTPRMTPIAAPTYLSEYYNTEPRRMGTVFQMLIQQYEAWDLIDAASLADTWPQEKWPAIEADTMTAIDTSLAARPASSLREIALARLVETALQNTDSDLSWIAEAELFSDFLPAVRKRLYSEPTPLASPAVKALLLKAVEHDTEVDLSPFQDLSEDEVRGITCRLSKKTTSLGLPRNMTSEILASLAAERPLLRRICVLDAPKVQLRSVLRVMNQHRATWIDHVEMFRAPFRDQNPPLPDYDEQTSSIETADPLINAGEKFPVTQIFWLHWELLIDRNIARLDDGGLPWPTLLPPSADLDPYLTTARQDPCLGAFPLHDAFMPSTRLVAGLVNFMHCLAWLAVAGSSRNKDGTMGMIAAKCFALATSDPAELGPRQLEVGPLPGQLFRIATQMNARTSGSAAPEVQPLRPGQWTIILAHEPADAQARRRKELSEEKLRYAFLTVPSTGESCNKAASATSAGDDVKARRAPIIADMKTFLDRTMSDDDPSTRDRLLSFWNEATDGLTAEVRVCGKEEIANIMELMPQY